MFAIIFVDTRIIEPTFFSSVQKTFSKTFNMDDVDQKLRKISQ